MKIRAVGIKDQHGSLSQIRLRQPLSTLCKQENYPFQLRLGDFDVDLTGDPGVLVTYRLHATSEHDWQKMDNACREGWLFVHDVDDDPRQLKGQIAHKFRSIAMAHIVTVTTPELLELCKEWNPNTRLLPNQIGLMPPKEIAMKTHHNPHVFFGAYNRSEEWGNGMQFVVDSLYEHSDHIELFILHDPEFAKQFESEGFPLRHTAHQDYPNYLRMIDHMDISLIPLRDTPFNRCKSDLKIIEALAHGMVPIVSEFAIKRSTVPNELCLVVKNDDDWSRHLNFLLDEPSRIKEYKDKGYDYVLQNRHWNEHAFEIDRIYKDALADLPDLEAQRLKRMAQRKELGLPA